MKMRFVVRILAVAAVNVAILPTCVRPRYRPAFRPDPPRLLRARYPPPIQALE